MSSLRVLSRSAKTVLNLPFHLGERGFFNTLLLRGVNWNGFGLNSWDVLSLKPSNRKHGLSTTVFKRYKHQNARDDGSLDYTEITNLFKENPSLSRAEHLIFILKKEEVSQELVTCMLEVYDSMLQNDINPTPEFLAECMYISNNYNPEITIKIFDDTEEYSLVRDSHVFQNALYAVFRTLNLDTAKKMVEIFKRDNFKPTSRMCHNLFTVFNHFGDLQDSLALLNWMLGSKIELDKGCFVELFKIFSQGPENFEHGKRLHQYLLKTPLSDDESVLNHVLHMYVKCGTSEKTIEVFESFSSTKNVFLWNAVIKACTKNRDHQKAIDFYERAVYHVIPDEYMYSGVLMAISNIGPSALLTGKKVHQQIIRQGLEFWPFLTGSLIQMYDRCNEPQIGIELYEKMLSKRHTPNDVIMTNALKCCSKIGPLELHTGKRIHQLITTLKLDSNHTLLNSTMQMYEKCGQPQTALALFDNLKEKYIIPDSASFSIALAACATLGPSELPRGEKIHKMIANRKMNLYKEIPLTNSLMKMYIKCGNPSKVFDFFADENFPMDDISLNYGLSACYLVGQSAYEIGREIHQKIIKLHLEADSILASSLMKMYASFGEPHKALKIFDEAMMKNKKFTPNEATYVSLLIAVTSMGEKGLLRGKQIHQQIVQKKYDCDLHLINSLIQMYEKCGEQIRAVELYDKMKKDQITPDEPTFINILECISKIGPSALEKGKQVHQDIILRNPSLNVVINNALIQMYNKCGEPNKSIELYDRFIEINTRPNELTFIYTLDACGSNLEKGKKIHQQITQRKFDTSVKVLNYLIEMYSRCGEPNKSIELYDRMILTNIKPDDYTFSNVLGACVILGNKERGLEKGKEIHQQIIKQKLNSNGRALGALMKLYKGCGEPKKALEIFEQLATLKLLKVEELDLAVQSCSEIGPSALEKGQNVHTIILKMKFEKNEMLANSLKIMYKCCKS